MVILHYYPNYYIYTHWPLIKNILWKLTLTIFFNPHLTDSNTHRPPNSPTSKPTLPSPTASHLRKKTQKSSIQNYMKPNPTSWISSNGIKRNKEATSGIKSLNMIKNRKKQSGKKNLLKKSILMGSPRDSTRRRNAIEKNVRSCRILMFYKEWNNKIYLCMLQRKILKEH